MKVITHALIFSLLMGCASPLKQKIDSLTDEELDIYESVFRYQFQNNVSAQQQGAHAYYISIYRYDPPEGYLKRFSGHLPIVLRRSECKIHEDGVIHRQTKEPGLIFTVGDIRWISESEVEVEGGYFENGRSASGNTYFLRRENGKWVCYSYGTRWISLSEQTPRSNVVNSVRSG
jgi:hypothetical protein